MEKFETRKIDHSQNFEWFSLLAQKKAPFNQITDSKTEGCYSLAYQLYQQKEFEEALHFFKFLVQACPDSSKYWKGLGACLQMLKMYEEALQCYSAAQLLNQLNPDLHLYLHAADCYFLLGDVKSGLKTLNKAFQDALKIKDKSVIHHIKLMKKQWSKKKIKDKN
ncbi:MAG: tetratricopeptide repeat protein [Parachlamydiaceae bacterium]|nr:tetratricopeptide repeat protein [Parachlamydiaceae bacterium]